MNWPDQPELYALLDRYEDRWKFLYPALNITKEVMLMAEWCDDPANKSRKPKKNWRRFAETWLSRNQSRLEVAEVRELVQHENNRLAANNQYIDFGAVLEQIQARKPRKQK